MIGRVWRGWTAPEDADAYERLLRERIFPDIEAKGVEGYRRIDLLRRTAGSEVEFMTIMWFDSMEAVERFAGEDVDRAYVPAAARKLLARFDDRSAHYHVRETRTP